MGSDGKALSGTGSSKEKQRPVKSATIVPKITPSMVSAKVYPPVNRAAVESMDLAHISGLAGECRDLLRTGCISIYERGAVLTKDEPELKAEHVQFLFDLANELVRNTLWEDGQLAEDKFAAEDSHASLFDAKNFAGIHKAEKVYQEIITNYPGTSWEAQAALERALIYSKNVSARWGNNHLKKEKLLLAKVVRDYAKTPQAAMALKELEKLKNEVVKRKSGGKKEE
ncbi:MAG: hypothetical protein GXP49_18050 [Deltaproteobacteria bacterium]|nr:hypothetical protein [Deltaproteobacteria bacterium]